MRKWWKWVDKQEVDMGGQRMAPKGVGKIKTGPRTAGVASMKGRQKVVAGGRMK